MFFESISHDIRYAVRGIRRSPLFALSVAATIGLGLGVLGSGFTVVNAFLLKPIDLPNPDELHALSWDTASVRRHRFRLEDFQALDAEGSPFSGVSAGVDAAAMHDGTLLLGRLVTSNYFQLLGAGAEIGRTLTPGDSPAVGGNAVVVLSNAAWRSRFGSDPAIVGKRVRLGRDTFDVVGAEGELALLVRGRVDNASVKAAVMAAVEAVDPDAPFQFYSLREMRGAQVWIVRMISTVASVLGALGLAFAFSGTYAVVAFLVTARTREFGIRLALGGTVPQIVRGILGEMLRITSVGLAGGLILAFGLVRFISGATPMILPFGAPPYLIGALVVVLAAATAALLPSLRAGRIDPSAALRAE